MNDFFRSWSSGGSSKNWANASVEVDMHGLGQQLKDRTSGGSDPSYLTISMGVFVPGFGVSAG